ncbi:MAG: glycosyltransferase family 39 protein [Flavobacteriales bacterium]|nr:glycosyltransferase family 39 protein [Flavobacteriales bacterium]
MRSIAKFVDQTLDALLRKNKLLFILSLSLGLCYYLFFAYRANFTDTAELARDSWSYQSIAVNFANGRGFHRVGNMGDFAGYKFADNYNRRYHNKFMVFGGAVDLQRNLGYPLFLSVVYKIFGVSPLIAKYIQLLLLVMVASFLPWIGRHFWGKTGILSGVISGILFLGSSSYVAGQIMSESLIITALFLIIAAYINYDSKKNRLSSVVLGLALGAGLLVKGSLIFIPLLLLLHMAWQYYKSKEKKSLTNLAIVLLFSVIPVLPWTLFVNIRERSVKQTLAEIKEIVFDEDLSLSQKQAVFEKGSFSMGKGFLPTRELSAIEKGVLRDSLLPAVRKNGFMLTDTILNPLARMALLEQITTAPSIHFLRLFVVQNLLLDGHNEYMKDGGWYPEWRSDPESFYNNDEMEGSSSITRVVNFYLHHPSSIFKLMWLKFNSAMSQFHLLWLISLLLIVEPIMTLVQRRAQARPLKFALLLLTLSIISTPFYLPVESGGIFSISLLMVLALSLLLLTRGRYTTLEAPLVLSTVFLNFFFIIIIGIGIARWTMVMEFVIAITAVNYLLRYVATEVSAIRSVDSNKHQVANNREPVSL